jgi:preprotein translocase subunit SecE
VDKINKGAYGLRISKHEVLPKITKGVARMRLLSEHEVFASFKFKACYDELMHKTSWPTRRELTHSAVIVLSASLVIALVVWLMDTVFKNLMDVVYSLGLS